MTDKSIAYAAYIKTLQDAIANLQEQIIPASKVSAKSKVIIRTCLLYKSETIVILKSVSEILSEISDLEEQVELYNDLIDKLEKEK
jgi:hypothetical protein